MPNMMTRKLSLFTSERFNDPMSGLPMVRIKDLAGIVVAVLSPQDFALQFLAGP